jgi:transposase
MQTRLSISTFIGVDVSKAALVTCAHDSGVHCTLANQRSAIAAWLKSLPAGSAIGVEATSTYHELLADLAHRHGLLVYVLNPKDVHGYAKSVGVRAKTDRTDAALIARYRQREHSALHPYCPPGREQRQLLQLLTRRAKLSRSRAGVQQSMRGVAGLSRSLDQLLERFDALIALIDARIQRLIKACPKREAANARLRSIKGVGPVIAPALLCALQRLTFHNADAFVAYTGFDPRPDDSGTRKGRRRLSKHGPSELRRLLYLAAMAAAHTAAWKPIYQRQLDKRLARTQALVIIARKIARTAWSIYTHNTTFNPLRLTSALT